MICCVVCWWFDVCIVVIGCGVVIDGVVFVVMFEVVEVVDKMVLCDVCLVLMIDGYVCVFVEV